MNIEQSITRPPTGGLNAALTGARDVVRKHGAGIAMALVLAAILVAPRWWMLVSDARDGARVPTSPYAAGAIGYDEALYTASIRDAYDGHIPVRDPFLVNHRDGPPQRSAVPHTLIGLLGRVSGGPFWALAIVTTLAAGAAFVLLYAMMVGLAGSRLVAFALMPIAFVAIHVLNFADGILPLRHPDILRALVSIDPENQVHAWSRYSAPILVLAPFFAAVIALPRALEDGSRRWMATAMVSIALLVYTYVYYWTALGAALAAWMVVLLLRGERVEARRLLLVGGMAALIALPEVLVVGWAGRSLPADVRDRVGLDPFGIDTSLAATIGQRMLVGVPFLLALLRGPSRNQLYVALFMAPLALSPLQGVVPQQWHYQTQVWGVFAIPGFVAGGAAIASRFRMGEVRRVAYAGLAVIAAGSLLYGAALQGRAIAATADGFVISDAENAAFEWMRAHLSDRDTVVSPSISTNLLLASLTPSAQYLADGGFSYADDSELIERILRVQAAYGFSEDDMLRRVSIDGQSKGFPLHETDPGVRERERMLEDYLAFFTFSFEIEDRAGFAARAETWPARYRALLAADDPLSAYPANYLYCGPRERYYRASALAPGTYVRIAFEQGDVVVYERVDAASDGALEFRGCPA